MCSVLLYVASAMMLYGAMFLAFLSLSFAALKWWIVGSFAMNGALLLLAGLWLKRFRAWRRDAGTVLLSASGMTALVVLTLACFLMDDNLMKMVATSSESLATFDDYVSGGSVVLGASMLGGLLLLRDAMAGR